MMSMTIKINLKHPTIYSSSPYNYANLASARANEVWRDTYSDGEQVDGNDHDHKSRHPYGTVNALTNRPAQKSPPVVVAETDGARDGN